MVTFWKASSGVTTRLVPIKTFSDHTTFIRVCLMQTDSDCSPRIMSNGNEVDEVYSTKFLGIFLDEGLIWNCHVLSVYSNCPQTSTFWGSSPKIFPTQVLMMTWLLCNNLPTPILRSNLVGWLLKHKVFEWSPFISAFRISATLHRRESCIQVHGTAWDPWLDYSCQEWGTFGINGNYGEWQLLCLNVTLLYWLNTKLIHTNIY